MGQIPTACEWCEHSAVSGNVMLDCRVGIQIINFTNGDSLQLTGHGKILFDERSLPGMSIAVMAMLT